MGNALASCTGDSGEKTTRADAIPYCTVPFQHRGNRQPRLGGLQRPSARHLRADSVTVPIALALALLQAPQQRIKNVDVNIMR